MSTTFLALFIFAAVSIGMWLVWHVIEALRPLPDAPAKLRSPSCPLAGPYP